MSMIAFLAIAFIVLAIVIGYAALVVASAADDELERLD